ncbi:MAG: hypothetical protein M3Q29_25395 [Chloroflexota bacterium]|nr:hypothetical protein [Chloroflexota bacterium]
MIPASSIPQQLRVLPQWVCWRLVPDTNGEKPRKVPYKPAGLGKASSTDASTWGTFEQARQAAHRHQHNGCGFVFSKDDTYAGIDLDNCRDPESGELETWAAEYVEAFNTYTEISPSGRGVKLVCQDLAPHNGKNGRNGRHPGQVEMYDRERFFALTGNVLPGYSTIRNCQLQLEGLYAREWPAKREQPAAVPPPGDVTLEDHELLERMFGGNPETKVLYNWVKQPSDDESALDLSLCNHLAWWTDRKPEQMDRLFRGSALMRPKWDERRGAQTYGERTIRKAIQSCHGGYDPTRTCSDTKQCTESTPEPPEDDHSTHIAPEALTRIEALQQQLRAKDARLTALEVENQQLRAYQARARELEQENAELRKLQSATARLVTNPSARKYAAIGLRLAAEVAAVKAKEEPTEYGDYRISHSRLRDVRYDEHGRVDPNHKPVCSENTLRERLQELPEIVPGLRISKRPGLVTIRHKDQQTGEQVEREIGSNLTYVDWSGSASELVGALADLQSEKPEKRGGKRCPGCGSRSIRPIQWACEGCGEVFCEPVIEPTDDTPSEFEGDTPSQTSPSKFAGDTSTPTEQPDTDPQKQQYSSSTPVPDREAWDALYERARAQSPGLQPEPQGTPSNFEGDTPPTVNIPLASKSAGDTDTPVEGGELPFRCGSDMSSGGCVRGNRCQELGRCWIDD